MDFELMRVDRLKADAEKAANEGKGVDANPYPIGNDPRRHDVWLTYYFAQVTANEETVPA